jgi:hypothetical protein
MPVGLLPPVAGVPVGWFDELVFVFEGLLMTGLESEGLDL